MNFAINIIDKVNDNSGLVTITGNSISTVTESTNNGGFSNEERKYKITGSATLGVNTTIATVTVTQSASTRIFVKAPYLSFSDNVKLKRTSITKDTTVSKSITTYSFDLLYKNTKATYPADNITLKLNYNDVAALASTANQINKIIFGKKVIDWIGDKRKISVYGTVGATFILRINEVVESKNSDGEVISFSESSILDSSAHEFYSDYHDQHGEAIAAIRGTIPSSGVYSFDQTFPSNVVVTQTLNGAMGGDRVMDLDSATGIKVGDEIIMSEIPKKLFASTTTRQSVEVLVDSNTVTPTYNITAIDNQPVTFLRPKAYYIHCSVVAPYATMGSNIPTTIPTYRIPQPLNPILSIKTSTDAAYTINGVTAGTAYVSYYRGKPLTRRQQVRMNSDSNYYDATITYTLVRSSGAFAIVGATAGEVYPRFSTNQSQSAWTNSTPLLGGGYTVSFGEIITALSTTSSSNDTATITVDMNIDKWGVEDLEMVVDLTKFIKTA